MEKLDHDHIVKLVGSYCYRNRPELYLLLWPVAVCNLDDLFNDLHQLQTRQDDRDEILSRLATLDLTDLDAFEHIYSPGKHVSPSYGDRCLLRYLRQMMGCLTRALAYLHNSDVRHLDLKPGNILLSPGRVYLADFGIARDVHDRENTLTLGQQGTLKWRAPEVSRLSNEWSMRAADVYSLGMVLLNISTVVYGAQITDFDCVTGKLPEQGREALLDRFLNELEEYALATQEYNDFRAPTVGPRHTVDLIRRMSSTTPSERPTADEVDLELVELGGIEQIYHASCCRKSSRFLAEKIDSRLKHVTEDRNRLQAEQDRITKRIAELEAKDATYETRVIRERTHAAERLEQTREQLEKRLEVESKERKRLEARLMELQTGKRHGVPITARRTTTPAPATMYTIGYPGSLKKPSRPPTNPLPATSMSTPAVQSLVRMPTPITNGTARPSYSQAVSTGASSIPVPQTATRRDSIRRDSIIPPANLLNSPIPPVGPKRSPTLEVGPFNHPLRSSTSGSRLPRAVNPSTPIRSNTPSTPRYNRNTSSADSTQNSMTSSTLSLNRSRYSDLSMPTTVENTPSVDSPSPIRVEKSEPDEPLSESRERNPATAIHIESVGLGLGYEAEIQRAESIASRDDHEEPDIRDDSSVVSFAPSTTTAPSVKSGYSRTAERKIPSMPTAPSWADVARTIPQLRI